MAKKVTAKPEVKAAETAVKATVPKTEEKTAEKVVVKAEEKKAAAETKTAAETKSAEPVKNEAVKKEAAPKPAEKKKPGRKPAAKKAAAKKAEVKSSVCIQYSGKSYTDEDLVKIARDVWKYDLKQKLGDLESIELYVKPEENAVYYVMNKDFGGSFMI